VREINVHGHNIVTLRVIAGKSIVDVQFRVLIRTRSVGVKVNRIWGTVVGDDVDRPDSIP
jgi:hypothetical protein